MFENALDCVHNMLGWMWYTFYITCCDEVSGSKTVLWLVDFEGPLLFSFNACAYFEHCNGDGISDFLAPLKKHVRCVMMNAFPPFEQSVSATETLNNCFSLISSAVSSQFCMLVNSVGVFMSHNYLFSCLDLCSMGKVKLSNSTSITLLPSSPDNYPAVTFMAPARLSGEK